MKTNMEKMGLGTTFLAEASLYPDMLVGRVFSQHKGLYGVICENGAISAKISGKFHYDTLSLLDFPVVGDFVMLDFITNKDSLGVIHMVLTRKSVFARKEAGRSHNTQAIASNIDVLFICMSLNNDFSLRRVERYLSIAWDSGAVPVVVLTKSDMCDDLAQKIEELSTVAIGVDILTTSALSEDGYTAILPYIKQCQTVAFVGSSGVGKSTLINRLLGDNIIPTKDIDGDQKGRHTTTGRELFVLKNGAMVIDTPGMREIGIEGSGNISKSFVDIEELAVMCKFRNCTHLTEAGCAVQKAISDNTISYERLSSYNKLKNETSYDGLSAKQLEKTKIDRMFKDVGGIKNAKKWTKQQNMKRY